MPAPLIATKLFLPPLRPDRVERPRLLDRLDDLLRPSARVALISAPAGFGKTSLLAEWLRNRDIAAAWVGLDAGDNAPGTLLAYLLAAIERVQPGSLRETTTLAQATPPAPQNVVLATLINELSQLPVGRPLVLALDDAQFLSTPDSLETLTFMAEHLPPGLRLAFATRADPALPLARLRARAQLVELRASDLRFTEAEAADFLLGAMGLRLDPGTSHEWIAALHARTEGWIAGLQMAALALQAAPQANPAEFIRSFSGSHRYVLDYLVEEILARLPAETVAFLLRTSILERFCAPLCAALTGSSQAGEMLAALEHSNLFLIQLDAERRWYRYHHLFTDLLRVRLQAEHPDWIQGLHQQASAWFEANQLPPEAIRHALAAADYDRAARLVEQNTLAMLRAGQLHTVLDWAALLPANLSAQRPWLCIYRAWAVVFQGNLAALEPLLQQALARLGELPEGEQTELRGHIAAIRAQAGVVRADAPLVYEQARLAAQALPDPLTWPRSTLFWSQGYIQRLQGRFQEATQNFEALIRSSDARGDSWEMAMAATDLGLTLRVRGRLQEALQVYRAGLAFLEAHNARRMGFTSRLLTALGAALYDQNELEVARGFLMEAVELNQRWVNPNHAVFSHVNLARVLAAQGDLQGTADQLAQARTAMQTLPIVITLSRLVEATETLLLLSHGRAAEVHLPGDTPPPLGPLPQDAGAPFPPYHEALVMQQGLLARVRLAQNLPSEAEALLEPLESLTRHYEARAQLLDTLVLRALSQEAHGKRDAAEAALTEAIRLAAPQGALRPFLDAAPLAPSLLAGLLPRAAVQPGELGFIERLRGLLPEIPTPVAVVPAPSRAAPAGLVEPLSVRELEVLALLADGLTNLQIAARLFISAGTVKAHTANIFRKLDAANRTQAVTKARELRVI